MKKVRNSSLMKKLNWLSTLMSVLVFVFSAINFVGILGDYTSTPPIFGGTNSILYKMDERATSHYNKVSADNNKAPIKFTKNPDGTYGKEAVLEALKIIRANFDSAKENNGYAVETFAYFPVVAKVLGMDVNASLQIYRNIEEYPNDEVYFEESIFGKMAIVDLKAGEKRYFFDDVKDGKIERKSKHAFSSGVDYVADTGVLVPTWHKETIINKVDGINFNEPNPNEFDDDVTHLFLENCKLEKELGRFKLTLNYNPLGTKYREDYYLRLMKNENGVMDTLSNEIVYYITKNGMISHCTKKSELSGVFIIPENAFFSPAAGIRINLKTTLNEVTMFNHLSKNSVSKKF